MLFGCIRRPLRCPMASLMARGLPPSCWQGRLRRRPGASPKPESTDRGRVAARWIDKETLLCFRDNGFGKTNPTPNREHQIDATTQPYRSHPRRLWLLLPGGQLGVAVAGAKPEAGRLIIMMTLSFALGTSVVVKGLAQKTLYHFSQMRAPSRESCRRQALYLPWPTFVRGRRDGPAWPGGLRFGRRGYSEHRMLLVAELPLHCIAPRQLRILPLLTRGMASRHSFRTTGFQPFLP